MKKIILSLLPLLLLISSVFAQDYDLCVDQCGLDFDSDVQCDLMSCYDSCYYDSECDDYNSCVDSCEGDSDCEYLCLDSNCDEHISYCQGLCDTENESCVEEVENQYNSCVLQCENSGTDEPDEPDVPVIPDGPGDTNGTLLPGGISSFSGTFLTFASTVSEFIPYIIYIGIGVLIALIGFVAIRWLILWIRSKVFNSFNK